MLDKNKDGLIKIPLLVEDMTIKREIVLARPLSNNEYILHSIPAFAYGVAFGDKVAISDMDKGVFNIITRGNNVTIRLFRQGTLDTKDIDDLIKKIISNGGAYEVGKNISAKNESSLLLINVPVSIGFTAIEEMMKIADQAQSNWEYGNVYNKDGDPIGWWS